MLLGKGKISGYIIIDVKRTFIEEVLAKAKSCLGSQEVFMLSNGTQIEANAGKVTLAEQSFYQKTLEQEEVQGFSYNIRWKTVLCVHGKLLRK